MASVRSYSEEIYKTYSSPKHRLGAIIEFPDGSMYRFAKAGAAQIAAGRLCQSPATTAHHTNIAVVAAVAAGGLEVTVTLGATAVAKDEYKDGYLYVNDADGEGYTYRIKSHPAHAGSGGLAVRLYEDSPVKVALTTSSEATLFRNPFNNVIIHPSPPTAGLAGVSRCVLPANSYGWLQVRGPAAVLTEGTLVAGDEAAASTSTDGAVAPSAAAETDSIVGRVLVVNASTEHSLVHLALE